MDRRTQEQGTGQGGALDVLGLVDGHRDPRPAEDEPPVRHVLCGAVVREGLRRPHRVQHLFGAMAMGNKPAVTEPSWRSDCMAHHADLLDDGRGSEQKQQADCGGIRECVACQGSRAGQCAQCCAVEGAVLLWHSNETWGGEVARGTFLSVQHVMGREAAPS